MDFDVHYTEAQEEFRKEVRAWLQANIPPDMKAPVEEKKMTPEQYRWARQFRRRLGEKGWLAPLFPKEYGGGGLTMEEAIVVDEELAEWDIPVAYDLGITLCGPAIMVWGTEEQKQRYLPPILRGEVITWQGFTEPEAGTDLASLQTRAERQGDYYVLNGQKTFIGGGIDGPDQIYTPAVTRPDAPRHANMGAFIIPANTPGLTFTLLDLFAGGIKRHIYYDNVRVPATNLIGGEADGWKVINSTLELEHGGTGAAVIRNRLLERLLDYCRTTRHNGQPLSKDPKVREAVTSFWMTAQVERLFGLRNYWMRQARVPWAWEGSQNSLYTKLTMPRTAKDLLAALGPQVLISDPKWTILESELESHQRQTVATHPGGTVEAQKIIMGRRIGIGRHAVRQQAAAIF